MVWDNQDMGDSEQVYLYHGTRAEAVVGILERGLPAPSYWGSRRMAEHWAGLRADGGEAMVIAKPLADFDPGQLFWDDLMAIEPAWSDYLVEADREAAAVAAEGAWEDSLAILESVSTPSRWWWRRARC